MLKLFSIFLILSESRFKKIRIICWGKNCIIIE